MKTYFTTVTEVLHQNILDKKQQQKQCQPQKKRTQVIVKDASGYEHSWFMYVCVSAFIIYFNLFFSMQSIAQCVSSTHLCYIDQVCIVADQTFLFQFYPLYQHYPLYQLSGSSSLQSQLPS